MEGEIKIDRTESERKIGPMGEAEREREDRNLCLAIPHSKRVVNNHQHCHGKRHLAFNGPLLPTPTGSTIQAN